MMIKRAEYSTETCGSLGYESTQKHFVKLCCSLTMCSSTHTHHLCLHQQSKNSQSVS